MFLTFSVALVGTIGALFGTFARPEKLHGPVQLFRCLLISVCVSFWDYFGTIVMFFGTIVVLFGTIGPLFGTFSRPEKLHGPVQLLSCVLISFCVPF
jgi:hypothetical protein